MGRVTSVAGMLAVVACLVPGLAGAQNDGVKVGVLSDMSSIYADISGLGSVEAVKMAIEDAGGALLGSPIAVISADHQNKSDIGTNIARQWYDREGVDAILDVNNSAVAIGVSQIAKDKTKLALFVGAASTDMTGIYCTPVTAQWLYDTYSVVRGTVDAAQEKGPKTWFFITADYAFGHSLDQEASNFIAKGGGKVLGRVRVPIGTSDYASFLLQAQSSKADIIALALSGADLVNVVKQGSEFGIRESGQQFAAMLATEANIHAIGPASAAGIKFSSPFYWDLDDATRAFSARFEKRMKRPPTMMQAGVYSATNHYFKAVKAANSKDPATVMAKMHELRINDFMTKDGLLRVDGRVVRDVHLFEAKSAKESKGGWDIYKLISTTPGQAVTRPLNSACSLVK
jgi:branched-chain amino acid transport system substrate-binding protein